MIKMCWLFVWGGLLLYCHTVSAIVNVDELHFQKARKPLSGSVGLAGATFSGNTDKSNIALNGQVQWNQAKQINLLVLGYEYGKNGGERNVNNSFFHARHVRHYSDSFDYEIYAQLEENEFTRLTYRGLSGAGLRIPFGISNHHIAFLGTGGFREVERIADRAGYADEPVRQTGRWNFYLMSRYKGERLRFTNTLYWQPRMAYFPDRRALFVSILKVKATESTSMRFSVEVAHDSLPPLGVEPTDTRFRTGLEYEF